MIIENYEELMELLEKIQLAHKYNEKSVSFKKEALSVSAAQALVDKYSKGGKRGSA